MMHITKANALRIASACAVAVAAALVLFPNVREDIAFSLAPSAERAYEYGSRHFDATNPRVYDIGRASIFFAKTSEIESDFPYIHHQKARIAFLNGDFETAMQEINREIELFGSEHANSFYVRGLIEGFMGEYAASAADYETYLRTDQKNWAAINDYAWVLIKGERYRDALVAIDWGLLSSPQNPWLHNSRATALFEMDRLEEAFAAAEHAAAHIAAVTKEAWLRAYPGNDPLIASEGLQAFRGAIEENMHRIGIALEAREKSVQ